jgi:hypothetical protein
MIPKEEFLNGLDEVFFPKKKPPLLKIKKENRHMLWSLLFERFNYKEDTKSINSIDIYDFLISMSIISRISNDGKLNLILKLIDVDEDSCLSIGEIFKMILAIEKNFVKELNYLNFQSGILFNETAFVNALNKFSVIMIGLKKPVDKMVSLKYITQTLVTYPEFMRVIKKNKSLEEKFLPYNMNLADFLVRRNL